MAYCTYDDLKDVVLEEYLEAVEDKNPGISERRIQAATDMINDGFKLASMDIDLVLAADNQTLREICAVIASYQIVSALTTLVDTDGSTGNEWLPLQKRYNWALTQLENIKKGRMNAVFENSQDSLLIASGSSVFGPDVLEKF